MMAPSENISEFGYKSTIFQSKNSGGQYGQDTALFKVSTWVLEGCIEVVYYDSPKSIILISPLCPAATMN